MKNCVLAIFIVLLIAGFSLLFFFNPEDEVFFPVCFFKYVTGLPCPGCGLQRAMHQLMHGHIKASLLLCPYAYFLAGVFLSMWIFPRATRTLAFALFVLGTTFVYAILRIFGLVP